MLRKNGLFMYIYVKDLEELCRAGVPPLCEAVLHKSGCVTYLVSACPVFVRPSSPTPKDPQFSKTTPEVVRFSPLRITALGYSFPSFMEG